METVFNCMIPGMWVTASRPRRVWIAVLKSLEAPGANDLETETAVKYQNGRDFAADFQQLRLLMYRRWRYRIDEQMLYGLERKKRHFPLPSLYRITPRRKSLPQREHASAFGNFLCRILTNLARLLATHLTPPFAAF